ncbi:type I restriction enzyme M protein [Azospirillum sp. OGB3]|uniref:class I SAM-dependent DNA methyltransferase n=1 Tax=Azospirillum sp. OGB3 TaxID=2587012 RepID=UPI001606E737|nr:class I SAM-dependent DNA methyltransferase [Azospirillum sp. OGB3]MBB3267605.1 type I restriction enzyme M protein [Azospirillum sp. OGB3]
MPRPRKADTAKPANGAAKTDFKQTLWAAADKLRKHIDAAEYKHVVLGLIFLKYISDRFLALHEALERDELADPEDRDEYEAESVFWVPKEARWPELQKDAKKPEIGTRIDAAMDIVEKANPTLKGVLPKDYGRASLDKQMLGELVDLIGTIELVARREGENGTPQDILGHVYEYFLGQFAAAEGKKGGQFYTPECVVKLLVEMIEPYKGRVYDPCCGSGGMFVQSEKFVEAHNGRRIDLSIFGQESNHTTWKLARMNLAIRGIEANLGDRNADSFHDDLHKDLKADFILANPPFNDSDWGGERRRDDVRWAYGVPPAGNANLAWVQHFIHHLAPNGVAGFVLANGSMTSNQSGEGEIRKAIVEADLVDCMVALPGQLFFTTQIPVCLWFLSRNKAGGKVGPGKTLRDRRGEVLFIDARKLGRMVDRVRRELTDIPGGDIDAITKTYHAWRTWGGEYEDKPGFCKSVTLEDIRAYGHVLAPGRYVGTAEAGEGGEPFELHFRRIKERLLAEFENRVVLEASVRKVLGDL